MAAEDFLGLRGFAQVVPQPSSNLYQLARLAQQGRQNDRDFELKRRQADETWFDNQLKTQFQPIRSELQSGLQQLYRETSQAMNQVYRSETDGLSNKGRETIREVKSNFDSAKASVESFDSDLDKLEKIVNADTKGLFNKGVFAGKLKDIVDRSYTRNQDGSLSINPVAMKEVSTVMNDPDIWDDVVMGRDFVSKLGTISKAYLQERANEYVTGKVEATRGLFKIGNDGTVELDKNTGQPIPVATPESIRLWDGESGSPNEKKLDKWAQSITPEGKNWRDYRGQAFKKFVVDQFGEVKEDKPVVNEKSQAGEGLRKKEANADERYDLVYNISHPTISNYKENERRLQQVYDPEGAGRVRAYYANGGVKAEVPGEKVPDSIILERRELIRPNPITDPLAVSYSDWTKFDEIPLNTAEERDAGMMRVNALINKAQATGLTVDQGDIEVRHRKNANKEKPKIDLGFKKK